MRKTIASLLVAGCITATAGGTPIFYLTALDNTNITLSKGQVKEVTYKVRNQAVKPHNIVMRKVVGITELTGADTCGFKIKLKGGEACYLRLSIDGNTFVGFEDRSPRVCADSNILDCYTPSDSQILKVTLLGDEE